MVDQATAEERPVESNQRYYLRRASEERTAAVRSVTLQARDWHSKLAVDFAARAVTADASTPVSFTERVAVSACKILSSGGHFS